MALKIELIGVTLTLNKDGDISVYPSKDTRYTLNNSNLSIYHKDKLVAVEASNDIQDKDDATLASDAAVRAYLGQIVGLSNLESVSNSTVSRVAASATAVTLAAANEHRESVVIYNDSANVLHVKLGLAATSTDFTYYRAAMAQPEIVIKGYKGIITGIWDVATGAAQVTETHV